MTKKLLFILCIVFALFTCHMFGQTSQILIETQLTKYSNDVKTNTYYLTFKPYGGVSKSFSYTINNNDDNEKYFYNLVQLDKTNFPANVEIKAFNRVKPAIIGGQECSEINQEIFNEPRNASINVCHGVSRFQFLDLPLTAESIGNCKTISIERKVILTNVSYSWEYRKDNETQWNYFFYGRDYSSNGLNFVPNLIPELENYTGNLYIRFIVTNENFDTGKIENYISNITNFVITDCSPQYVSGTPPTTGVKCNNESNGSVTLKFKSELVDGDVFLFNIFLNKTPPEFIKHLFVSKSEIENNTYIWKDLGPGDYIIKYQAQRSGDSNEEVKGLSLEPIPPFTITNPDPLNFILTPIQPACADDKGKIQISASGGTPPYFYVLDDEPLTNKHSFTGLYTIPNELSEGDHSVIVVDSRDCIEK